MKEILGRLITPYAEEWNNAGKVPSRQILQQLGKEGVLACFIASEKKAPTLLERWGTRLPGGIRPSDYDAFHALILSEEIRVATVGCYGVTDGIIAGIGIGLPPIVKFGSPEMVERVVPQVIRGDKTICLAISEPYAGSDVQKIRTHAIQKQNGDWEVSGVKKWITNGVYADYFTTLCKTEEFGPTMLLVERDEDEVHVQTKLIKTSCTSLSSCISHKRSHTHIQYHRLSSCGYSICLVRSCCCTET